MHSHVLVFSLVCFFLFVFFSFKYANKHLLHPKFYIFKHCLNLENGDEHQLDFVLVGLINVTDDQLQILN